jgi:hypothetical protein
MLVNYRISKLLTDFSFNGCTFLGIVLLVGSCSTSLNDAPEHRITAEVVTGEKREGELRERFEDADPPGLAAAGERRTAEVPSLHDGARTPDAATKKNPFVNSLKMEFVPVPVAGGTTGGKLVLFSIWE